MNDELAPYFNRETQPKILITTSDKPCVRSRVCRPMSRAHSSDFQQGITQGWQVCDEAVVTAGKNTVITGSSQNTQVVTNCRKPSQTQK